MDNTSSAHALTAPRLVTQTFVANATTNRATSGHVDLVNTTPNPEKMSQRKSHRKFALATVSFALIAAVGCIALVIGSSTAEAAHLPVFTAANALSAKQDAGVAGIATASVVFAAVAALAVFSAKK